ncbi:unnamed protein product, partial [Prorocentrum cordatum]
MFMPPVWALLGQHDPSRGRVSLFRVITDSQRCEDLALVRAIKALVCKHLVANAHNEDLNCGISYETLAICEGYDGVEDYCRRVVTPLGEDARSLVPKAIPEALGADLRVVLLDRQGALSIEDYPLGCQ